MIQKAVEDIVIGTAHAQSTGISGSDFFGRFTFKTTGGGSAQGTFSSLIGNVLVWVMAIVGLIAFIYLIMQGVKYITSGGDAAKATEARNGIINAIIGIVVVVLAYVVVRFAFNLGNAIAP